MFRREEQAHQRPNVPDSQEILKILLDNKSLRMKMLLKHKSKFNLSSANEQKYVLHSIEKFSVEDIFKE